MKKLFRKLRDLLFRKKTHGTVRGQKFDNEGVTPEAFRRMFAEAYPDAAKLIESIKVLPNTKDAFLLTGSFVATGFISAAGLSTSCREWERKCLEDTKKAIS